MLIKGTMISNRYTIKKHIGDGGMADVYLASDDILKRDVAIKVLRGSLAKDDISIKRFEREALAVSKITDKNIISIYDVCMEENKYYIVMEYIDGITLKELVASRTSISCEEAVNIIKQLLGALVAAHEKRIVHRDIKPQNIMILNDGLVKLMDFGIALTHNATQITESDSVIGSIHYLAPEIISGKQATAQTDIYAVGILLYELIIGKYPFTGETPVQIAMQHIREEIPRVTEINSQIPISIENIISKATAKTAENRYESAQDMLDDLDTAFDSSRLSEKRVKINNKNTDLDAAKQKFWTKSKIAVFGIGIAILIGIITIIALDANANKTYPVPNVIGIDANTAKQRLENAGFKVDPEFNTSFSDTIGKDKVIKITPNQSKLKKQTVIKLEVSKGTDKIKIPDLAKQDELIATNTLKNLGLEVSVKYTEISKPNNINGYVNGSVISSLPTANELVKEGSIVTLEVALIYEVYPNMVAEDWSEAKVSQFAETYKLNLQINFEYSATIPEGKIISQSREPNQRIIEETQFSVVFSKGKEPTPEVKPPVTTPPVTTPPVTTPPVTNP